MKIATDKFYNMRVKLVDKGQTYIETVAVKDIWEKNGSIFLNFYFHRLKKSFVLDSAFVRGLFDVSNDKNYADIHQFVADFTNNAPQKQTIPSKSTDILSPIKPDIVMMMFIADCTHQMTNLKEKIIFDYIKTKIKGTKNLSESYLRNTVKNLSGTETDFYAALQQIKHKTPKEAENLLKEIVKICLCDGYIHYTERMYVADIAQFLRQEGVQLPLELI